MKCTVQMLSFWNVQRYCFHLRLSLQCELHRHNELGFKLWLTAFYFIAKILALKSHREAIGYRAAKSQK